MRHVLRRRRLKSVVVTMKSGQAFRGALWMNDPDAIVLRSAVVLSGNEAVNVPIDGELILLRSEIAYLQRPG